VRLPCPPRRSPAASAPAIRLFIVEINNVFMVFIVVVLNLIVDLVYRFLVSPGHFCRLFLPPCL
ncbi:MAG: hypothetical protein ABSF34_14730, partial [Verrucomicrobiota bacterium]